MTTIESPFERKMRERREAAERNAQTNGQPVAGASSPTTAVNDDHVPDIGDDYTVSPEQEALDKAIESLDIVLAYQRWCGKMTPKWAPGQSESIMISCPDPAHPDKNPSAWINRKKQVYHCSGCSRGGDIWDIAAYHFGFPVPGYKEQTMFRQLREKIGADLGFQQVTSVTGQKIMIAPGSSEEDSEADSDPEPASGTQTTAVLPAGAAEEYSKEEYEENQKNAPTINWRSFVKTGTFLHAYLEATTVDTCPEEYHFWNGIVALGFAVGREITLDDTEQVVANLFICLTGPSSAGKSRSVRHLSRLLRTALPYDINNKVSRGAKIIKAPGSAEYLVSTFTSVDEMSNPATGGVMRAYYPVRGLVEFGELSQLMSTAGRVGNAIRPQLMELFDAPEVMESGSQTTGVRHAEYPFGSVLSTTQNRSLRKLLDKGDDGSGFINRWVFAQGKLKKRLPMGGPNVDTSAAASKLVQIHQWAFRGRKLQMSAPALDRWSEFFYSTVVPTQDKADEQGTAVLARMDLLMKKLFLLFAVNSFEEEVSLESVEQAIALWPYLLKTFGAVNVEMRKTSTSDLQEEVLVQIKRLHDRNSKPPSRKEIYDCVKRKISDTKELVDLLAVLVKAELVHEIHPPSGVRGRPTMRYEVA